MFDLSSIEPAKSDAEKAPVPDGKYTVVCSDALLKDTNAGTGQYIMATFTIKAGTHKGEKITQFFNVANQNPVATRIGKEELINFLRSSTYSGDYKFESFEDAAVEMCGLLVGVSTKTEPPKGEYGPRAKIKKFYPIAAAAGTPIPTAPAASDADEKIPF
jgi:Protein of unknown function (DUF669)